MLNDNLPLVSIIITCFNMEQYVSEAIESALNQTYKNIEVIVINDGSIDASDNIIQNYVTDSRVRYVKQENAGQANAKNKGIKLSKGTYITFLDSDDLWLFDKIEKQVKHFEKYKNAGIIYTDVGYIDGQGNILNVKSNKKFYSGNITKELFFENFIPFSSVMVKRECFYKIGVFNENYRMAIDWDLWLRISTEYEVYFLDEITFYYRVWPGQMSKNIPKRFDFVWKIREKFIEEYPNELSKLTVKKAWAKSFNARAWYAREIEKSKKTAIRFYFRSLKSYPFYWYAWRGLVKAIFL